VDLANAGEAGRVEFFNAKMSHLSLCSTGLTARKQVGTGCALLWVSTTDDAHKVENLTAGEQIMDTLENRPASKDETAAKHVTNVKDTLRKIDSGPSVHNTADQKKAKQVPVDLVEEELMESFPASDPPSHAGAQRPESRRPGQDA
jgi:hypothetical protein